MRVSQIRLRILGESVIEVGDTIVEPSATHLFALLLYLAIERGKLITRGQLASLLFPDVTDARAAHNLRQLLYRLRRIGVPLESTAAAVRLPGESVVEAPESILIQGAGEAARKEASGFALLPSYAPPTPPLSHWLEGYRDEISSKLLRSLARDLVRAREGAEWSTVERLGRALLALDPFNETATLGLAEALARTGSKHKAVKLLADFADDVGQSHGTLALPSRLLTKRIAEDVQPVTVSSPRIPLIGRSEELRSLNDAWSHARRGNCSIAVISGEKSIGKTRVLEELCALVRMDGSGVAVSKRMRPGDSERPMSLFSDLCTALLALPGAAGCNPNSLPHLRRLQAAPALEIDSVRADADTFPPQTAALHAIVDLLDSVSSEQPLLICIDDADHLDVTSRDLLASIPVLAASVPILFVVTGSHSSRLPQRRDRSIRLSPLRPEDARALSQLICEATPLSFDATRIEWCIESAAGNPAHLDLLLRHSARLHDTSTPPPDLVALLDSRLELLGPPSKSVLQACVAFGADCCAATIAALTGLDGYELIVALEQLVDTGLVLDTPSGISCRSALLAERVAKSTTPVVRGLFHRRAAMHLERAEKHNRASQAIAWRIADHWQSSGDRSRAFSWRRSCWRQLLSIGQPMAAAESIRSFLHSSSTETELAALLDELILALQHGYDAGGQLAALQDRVALSDRIGDTSITRLRLAADIADARLANYEDTNSLLSELKALVASPALDQMRRIRAARALMVSADSLLDESLARWTYDTMPKRPSSGYASLLKQQVDLIYHAVFGDRDAAAQLAMSLDLVVNDQELSPATVTAHLTAASALRIVDSRLSDTRSLERLVERCLGASMFSAAMRASARIGNMCFDDGQLEMARVWCQRAAKLVENHGIQRLGGDYVTLHIDLAIALGDLRSAQRFLAFAPQHLPLFSSPRAKREQLVYRVRVDQETADRPNSAEDIDALMEWHERAKRLGRHDDNMQVLWTALWRAERRPEASALLRDYLTNARRERGACGFMLRTRTAEDSVWDELGVTPRRMDGVSTERLPQARCEQDRFAPGPAAQG